MANLIYDTAFRNWCALHSIEVKLSQADKHSLRYVALSHPRFEHARDEFTHFFLHDRTLEQVRKVLMGMYGWLDS